MEEHHIPEFRQRKALGLKQTASVPARADTQTGSRILARMPAYLLIALILVAVYFLYDLLLKPSLSDFWDRNADFLQTEYPEVDVIATLSGLDGRDNPLPKTGSDARAAGSEPPSELPVQELDISIARQFRVREFVMPPASREIGMSSSTDYKIRKTPENSDGVMHYGLLKIPNFGLTQLAVVTNPKRTTLYADLNHNLDLTDDGAPLIADSNAFAVILSIPMYDATGIMGLDGNYRLWIYRPENSGSIRYYPLTQLVGEITLGDQTYPALIAEMSNMDGNFLNDGIYVDWNRDGKFDGQDEHIESGQVVKLENGRFRLNLVH